MPPDATTDPFQAPDEAPVEREEQGDGTFSRKVARLVALKKEQDELDDRLAVIAKEAKTLKAWLAERFAEEGIQRINKDGRTVYLHRSLWAGAPDKAAAHEALIAAGLTEYATKGFNSNSVSALFREWERDGVEPPPELAGIITTGERFEIRVTRS